MNIDTNKEKDDKKRQKRLKSNKNLDNWDDIFQLTNVTPES